MSKSLAWLTTFAVSLVALAACEPRGGKAKAAITKAEFFRAVTGAAKSPSNALTRGQEVRGALEATDPQLGDQSHYDEWIYESRGGERIEITLESSVFDTYLILGRTVNGELQPVAENDDGADGTNSQISVDLPEAGSYTVLANSYGPAELGAYTLRVDTAQQPSAQIPSTQADWAARYPGRGAPRERYALLVGIDDYRGIGTSLDGPVADARLIGQTLVERYGFRPENVVTITDRDATREHIAEAFLRHLGQAGPDGLAVFYYSGHGMQMDSNYALTGNLDPETDRIDEALYVWGANGRGGVILDDELGFLADRLATNRVLFIIDACFSGTGTRAIGSGAPKEADFSAAKSTLTMPTRYLTDAATPAAGARDSKGVADLMREPQRHLLLAASADNQVSWTATGWPKYGGTISVFTYYLVDALERAAANATFGQVMQGVAGQTNSYTQSQYRRQQTPQTEGQQRTARIREFLARR